MTFFNFDCYALVSIKLNDHTDWVEPDFPCLCGFWLTAAEARAHTEQLEKQRRATAAEYWKNHRYTEERFEEFEGHVFYAVIPVSNLQADDLYDVTGLLENAAALQLEGIGTAIPAPASPL